MAVLRSLEKAVYAPLHVGHYALASACYCHFTSPIRRYADLHVHRLLEYYLQGDVASAKQVVAGRDLAEVGKHISFTEQRAQDAENELTTVLILQMLSNRIGEQLDCIVTGLTGFGVFVQSQRLGIEGLIQMSDLGDDHWKYDRKSQCIIGERSGHVIHLGQPMKVSIASVNVPARQLGVTPVEPLVGGAKKAGVVKKTRKGRAGRRKR
jgi:ribonuclease R